MIHVALLDVGPCECTITMQMIADTLARSLGRTVLSPGQIFQALRPSDLQVSLSGFSQSGLRTRGGPCTIQSESQKLRSSAAPVWTRNALVVVLVVVPLYMDH